MIFFIFYHSTELRTNGPWDRVDYAALSYIYNTNLISNSKDAINCSKSY